MFCAGVERAVVFGVADARWGQLVAAAVVCATPKAKKAKHLYLCAPLIRGRKGHHQPIASWIQKQGYALMRADGKLMAAEAFTKLDRYKEHDIEVVVADLKAGSREQGARGKDAVGNPKWLNEQLATALAASARSRSARGSSIRAWFSTWPCPATSVARATA